MFNLTLLDILFIFIAFLMIEHLLEKIMLYYTTKAAIKQAGVLGCTKEEIMRMTTDIVTETTKKAEEAILTKAKKAVKEEIVKIVDAENQHVALTLEKKKKK